MANLVLESASKRYEPALIRRLGLGHQIRLSRLLAVSTNSEYFSTTSYVIAIVFIVNFLF